jgi:lipoyl-dependent peroxiredoxin
METNTMDILYTAKVTATVTDRSVATMDFSTLTWQCPRRWAERGGATNPEQLFAGGYAACFENALLRVGREAGRRFAEQDIQVAAEIGFSKNPADAFVLSAALFVTIASVDQQTAETLVEGAHHICPYSNAIRGNVAVKTTVSVS